MAIAAGLTRTFTLRRGSKACGIQCQGQIRRQSKVHIYEVHMGRSRSSGFEHSRFTSVAVYVAHAPGKPEPEGSRHRVV